MPKKNVAKLNVEQVRALRDLYRLGWPLRRLGFVFGLSDSNARACALGDTYKTIPGACEPRPWPRDNRPAISAGRRDAFNGYVNMQGGLP